MNLRFPIYFNLDHLAVLCALVEEADHGHLDWEQSEALTEARCALERTRDRAITVTVERGCDELPGLAESD